MLSRQLGSPHPVNQIGLGAVYSASKMQAEEETWNFVKDKKPGFVFNAAPPNINMRQILHGNQPASTGAWIRDLYNGKIDHLKSLPPQWIVNVKDTARLLLR